MRIVVVGGGHAGVTVAQGVADAASVKLVDRSDSPALMYYGARLLRLLTLKLCLTVQEKLL